MSGERGSVLREAGFGLLFALLAVCLTWPLAASPGRAVSVRGDYFSNLWNFWWVGTALSEGASPWSTDLLHHPLGLDLSRHTLSLLNSLPGGVLARWIGPHDAFKVLLLVHFWLSGWFFFLFARRLTAAPVAGQGSTPSSTGGSTGGSTGSSTGGAVLAGIAWSFSPYHGYYFAQMNLATMEFIPLAAFFMVGAYRDGGRWNVLGVALSAALLAASCSYYVVYVAMLGALLLAGGRLWCPGRPWRTGAGRLAVGGALAGGLVVGVAWPLVSAMLGSPGPEAGAALPLGVEPDRSNDLLGFLWVGGPEEVLVSWPTMLGYATLSLVALGLRSVVRRPFWIGVALLFFVLSLGPTLSIGGEPTGRGLPYGWFADSALLSMLRKPDRLILMVQLALCVLVAYAWADVSARLAAPRLRSASWTVLALALALERAPLPAATYEIPVSPYLAELALEPEVDVVLDLPPQGYVSQAARRNFLQTLHHKKIVEGYATNLALRAAHGEAAERWERACKGLVDRDAKGILKRAEEAGVDLIVVHKTEPARREIVAFEDPVIWAPFCFVRRDLLTVRQLGPFVETPVPGPRLGKMRRHLREQLGPPLHADDEILVYRRER